MTEHTKTPWRVRQSDFQPFDLVITTTGKKPVFVATGIKNDMDAYHIVKAVNSHEKLIEALTTALPYIRKQEYTNPHSGVRGEYGSVALLIEQALAEATKGGIPHDPH